MKGGLQDTILRKRHDVSGGFCDTKPLFFGGLFETIPKNKMFLHSWVLDKRLGTFPGATEWVL